MPIEDYHRPEYKEKYPSLGGSVGAFRDVLPVRASLGIRLDAGKEIVGVIFVNYLDVQDFTDERIELAKQFANRAAYAIRNARIYNKALNTSRLLSTANKLTSLVGETQELMETALEDAVHLIGMDRGGIVLHEGTWRQTSSFLSKVKWQSNHIPRFKSAKKDTGIIKSY